MYNLVDEGEPLNKDRQAEMTGYYLLYFICYARSTSLYGNPQEILNVLLNLKPEIASSPAVQFSLNVLKALIANVDFVSMAELWSQASLNQRILMEVSLM
jgi:hypothetical protein